MKKLFGVIGIAIGGIFAVNAINETTTNTTTETEYEYILPERNAYIRPDFNEEINDISNIEQFYDSLIEYNITFDNILLKTDADLEAMYKELFGESISQSDLETIRRSIDEIYETYTIYTYLNVLDYYGADEISYSYTNDQIKQIFEDNSNYTLNEQQISEIMEYNLDVLEGNTPNIEIENNFYK